MLAQVAPRLPVGEGWLYEPKLDGFRGILDVDAEGQVRLYSRNGNDLTRWFPELRVAGQILPRATTLDGEIVLANESGFADFAALQARLAGRGGHSTPAGLGRPATLAIFDVLQCAGRDLTDVPLHRRRGVLEDLVRACHPLLQVVDQTADIRQARDWLTLVPQLEGVMAKRARSRYVPGRREWMKVKRRKTADCVVVGLAGDDTQPQLILGLRHTGELHRFGWTRPVPAELAEPVPLLLAWSEPAERPLSTRWQHQEIPVWRRVPPVAVCEVSYTNVDAGRWLRFPATLVRWRPDRSATDCDLSQLA
jgi:ATP-dependent DNA ligase